MALTPEEKEERRRNKLAKEQEKEAKRLAKEQAETLRLEGMREYEKEYELTCEYIYDEAGGKLQSICRSRGMLVRESFYSTAGDEDATVYWLSSEVEYYDDGSKCVFEYDQDGWIIRSTEYDAQGRVVQVDTFE